MKKVERYDKRVRQSNFNKFVEELRAETDQMLEFHENEQDEFMEFFQDSFV